MIMNFLTKIFWSLFIWLMFFANIYAQHTKTNKYQINYSDDYRQITLQGTISEKHAELMSFYSKSNISPAFLVDYKIEIVETTQISSDNWQSIIVDNEDFEHHTEITEVKGKFQLLSYIFPYRKIDSNTIEVVKSFNLIYTFENIPSRAFRNPLATYTSVLASGDIYKIKVEKSGLHKIDRAFLESDLGINLNNINPRHLKIYGARGGRIPEANIVDRIDDLEELHIHVEGEGDGKFDNNDYILFYAEGADLWSYNSTTSNYIYDKNIYDDYNYYYLKTSGDNGKRISKINHTSLTPEKTATNYDYLQRYEEDRINLLGAFSQTYGSGKDWYGDIFTQGNRTRNYTNRFDFSGIELVQPVSVGMAFAGRSTSSHSVEINLDGQRLTSNIAPVSFSNESETTYAVRTVLNQSTSISNNSPSLSVTMVDNNSNSTGWLDYISIISKRFLNLGNNQMTFRNQELIDVETAAFRLSSFTNQKIWDITEPLYPKEMEIKNNTLTFITEGLNREFLSHTGLTSAFSPTAVGKIDNQNLHAMEDQDMVIVYHPLFKKEAERLANHRTSTYGLKVLVASTEEVYNEFGGGKADPTAIRDLARLLLYRNPNFKYLLLFGDASYDYKGLMRDINFENFVPTYQSSESLSPLSAFPTDDYYGLLGSTEGIDLRGGLDIYVGRLTVRTEIEAENVVNKIIHYDTNKNRFGDWRLRTGYVADDGDNNLHARDMDVIARRNEERQNLHNKEKVYIDAYKLVSTSGEPRFPDANRAINDNVFKGQVALTYLGHGGPLGWAQERILTVPDIQNMSNMDKLTLMITATCSFGSYDDPSFTSPAEQALINPRGGAVALMTTSRVVFTNSNFQLTNAVHNVLFEKEDGHAPSFGRIMTYGKNEVPGINSRKFSLLGDPSQRIGLPEYNVTTTQINEKDVLLVKDTLRALSKVSFSGVITDDNGEKVSNFNGKLSATVFDKKSQLQTLSNTRSSPKFDFEMYRNVLFKGTVSVVNGEWTVTFWVPKNIDYRFGNGRLSLYATDGETDAGGAFEDFIIGGTNADLVNDDEGPKIEAFMNDFNFVNGGITNSNPVLLLSLSDDLGINVTGSAIGQDITATLDGDTRNIFILNDFYEANKDDFTSGIVRFPLRNLSVGSHFMTAKAWDISGNFTETRVDFVVADPADSKLINVFNYPNPFRSGTTFQFEHDMPNTDLEILIEIYSITGKLVKTLKEIKYSSGFRVNDMFWEGNDDFGLSLARGIYLYKITAHSKELNQTRESKFEKLVKM